jgi:PAS domain S-box-containing protein
LPQKMLIFCDALHENPIIYNLRKKRAFLVMARENSKKFTGDGVLVEALRAALELAESVVETVREPLIVLDENLKVVSANNAFYRTFQVTPQATEGRFIYELGNRQWDIPKLRELLEDIIPKNAAFEGFEVDHVFPSIGRKTMLLNAKRIEQRGKRSHLILLAIEDITTRKQAEETLRKAHAELEKRVKERTAELAAANQKLREEVEGRKQAERLLALKAQELARSNTDLEQFAYAASHDLREPLHVVAGFLGLLAKRCKGKIDAKEMEYIDLSLNAVARMGQMIDDILSYSRINTRGKEFELTDCNAVLDRVLEDLKLAIAESGAAITKDHLPTVMADSSQLARVFQNLIANAIKFRGDKVPEIHVGAERLENEWRFFVKDNGIGIPSKDCERIFLMFERLHDKSKYSGTGIGLAICKKIVERHGGHIWVESEPGRGSTFYFTIPANHE